MQQTARDPRVAALRELASRLCRCYDERGGKVYWRKDAPVALADWARGIERRFPCGVTGLVESYRVLHELCGIILTYTEGRTQLVTMQGVARIVASNQWSDTDVRDLLRWLEDDPSRVDLVDDHSEEDGILAAMRAARSVYRREIADLWLEALSRRAAEELAAWGDGGAFQSEQRD